MTHGSRVSRQVVDLLSYKRERQQQRLDFETEPRPQPSLSPVTPFRPLTADKVAHRQQMLRHLRVTTTTTSATRP